MKNYEVLPSELANAFDRAALFLAQGRPNKNFTIEGALRRSSGHNLRVLYACRRVVRKALEGMTVSEWLIANGVPESDVRGLKGFKQVTSWKREWLSRIAEESYKDSEIDNSPLPFTYPF